MDGESQTGEGVNVLHCVVNVGFVGGLGGVRDLEQFLDGFGLLKDLVEHLEETFLIL